MVFGTLKSLGGSTEIVSAPGRGTEVLLRFPAPVEDRTQAPLESPAEGAPPKRCLSVLLVDDDELIRGSVVPMLRILGHEAQAVDSGLKALNLFQGGLEVDLVILDMNMPGINGAETLHGILLLRPGQKVIMASGYNDHDVAGLLEGRPGVVSIQKPFLLKEVRRSLQALGLD
jgi:CheY-like chemotaxis protein